MARVQYLYTTSYSHHFIPHQVFLQVLDPTFVCECNLQINYLLTGHIFFIILDITKAILSLFLANNFCDLQ